MSKANKAKPDYRRLAKTKWTEIQTECPAVSIPAFRRLVDLPALNPATGSTLEITGFAGAGWFLRITDPMGADIWHGFLRGAFVDV